MAREENLRDRSWMRDNVSLPLAILLPVFSSISSIIIVSRRFGWKEMALKEN